MNLKYWFLVSLLGVISFNVFSQSGNCIRFDGTNDHIRVNHNSSLNISSTWTIEFWLNPDVTPSGWDALISKLTGDRPPAVWLYYNSVEVWYGSGTGSLIAYTNYGTITAGEWQHVAVTRSSGNTIKIYINGELESTTNSTSTPPTNSQRLYFAQRGDGAYYYDGYMDEVRYWDVERTQTQIRDNMCKTLTGSETGLEGYWKLDESSGGSTSDDAGSNNGSLRNSPTRSTSGAPIGVSSTDLYTSSWSGKSIYHTSTDGDSVRVSSVSGSPDGVIVYSVESTPNSTTGTAGLGGNSHYFGVFKANGTSPTYTMTYYFGNNTAYQVGGGADKSDLEVYQRTSNSTTSWSAATTSLNTSSNTLTATGLNSEFILGSSGSALPVDLLKFEGKGSPNGNELYWVTTSETNCDFYQLERSGDGEEWNVLSTVKGAGTTNEITKYHTTDYYPWEYTYYRITQFDFDGRKKVYNTILVDHTNPNAKLRAFEVNPSVAVQNITVKTTEQGRLVIHSSNGQLVYSNEIEAGELNIVIDDYPAGTYVASMLTNDSKTRTLRFIKIDQ